MTAGFRAVFAGCTLPKTHLFVCVRVFVCPTPPCGVGCFGFRSCRSCIVGLVVGVVVVVVVLIVVHDIIKLLIVVVTPLPPVV